jgi:tetratricopeptide (TPR) repeat protein
MKNSVKLLTILLILLTAIVISAQTNSKDKLIEEGQALSKKAYLQYKLNGFLEAREIFEKAFDTEKSDLLPLYYITSIDYKILEMSMHEGGDSLFNKYYEPALKNAERLINDNNFSADGKALAAAIYMMKIATSPMSAVTLSSKIHSLLDDAQSINPENPYSFVIRGMMKFNTPAMFGGSYEDALKNFSVAVKLFENEDNTNNNPVWGYIEALTWMGRTQEKLNNDEAARFTYKKVLSVEPEYGWVKYKLLPKLEEKQANNK